MHLFVYGTLQPQAGTGMAEWIAARLVRAEPATASGRLHAVRSAEGWFPALLRAPRGDKVQGTLCELALRPGDLARLDRYEGREYRRICLRVQAGKRGRTVALAYLWRIALPPKSSPIQSGDFLHWLRSTRRKAFSASRHGV